MQDNISPVPNIFIVGNKVIMTRGAVNREKLIEAIEKSGLSMREICAKAKVSESYVKQLKSGRLKSPTIEKFIRVTDVLGIPPNDLVPLEWQKAEEINERAFLEAVIKTYNLIKKHFKEEELTPTRFAHMALTEYKEIELEQRKISNTS